MGPGDPSPTNRKCGTDKANLFNLTTPALADITRLNELRREGGQGFAEVEFFIRGKCELDCVGLGIWRNATFGVWVWINYNNWTPEQLAPMDLEQGKGLYMFKQPFKTDDMFAETHVRVRFDSRSLDHDGIGRFAIGKACEIPTAVAKEVTFASTASPRTTLSGQVVPGLGGYSYRMANLDTRYGITEEIRNEIKNGQLNGISQGYPFFVEFNEHEAGKLGMEKFYGTLDKQLSWTLQNGIFREKGSNRYSSNISLREAF